VPNPVAAKARLYITSSQSYNTNWYIAADGKKLLQQPVYLNAGVNSITIDVSRLTAGAYFLVVNSKENGQQTIAFAKE